MNMCDDLVFTSYDLISNTLAVASELFSMFKVWAQISVFLITAIPDLVLIK